MYIGIDYAVYLYKEVQEARNFVSFEEKMKNVFEHMYTSSDELKLFYDDYKLFLRGKELFEIEIRVFRDQFEIEFQNSKKLEYDQCCFCLDDEFTNEEKVVSYPGCHHNFHFECLEHWLKDKNFCPICKSDFRSEFVNDLVAKIGNNFVPIT